MSTSANKKDFDYETYAEKHGPDPALIGRGPERRRQRREAAKQRITIRIDEDILDEFKQLVPGGRGYQRLINQALREWIAAKNIKELVRSELTEMIQKAVASIPKAG